MHYIWDIQKLKISFGAIDLSAGWVDSYEVVKENLNMLYLNLRVTSDSFMSLSEVVGTNQQLLITYDNKIITNKSAQLVGRQFSLGIDYPEAKFTFSL